MKHNRTILIVLSLLALASMTLAACGPAATPAAGPTQAPTTAPTAVPPTAVPAPSNPNLILATTTSTQDSGLLDVLIPLFEQETGYTVQTVAVGSGQAMTMGQEGNADVLLVHSPSAEVTFMAAGWGRDRVLVMHNDFIVVGPASDPAGIKGLAPVDAFKAIAAAGAPFISRGDNSGTNTKELGLWKSAKLDPAGSKAAWYTESGQGMGATLTIASEKSAYTLTDRATFLANQANLQLVILVEKDNALLNVYHVITVDPAKWPKVNYDGAIAFLKFMTEPSTQDVIGKFGVDKYGQQLFLPDAGKTDADFGLPAVPTATPQASTALVVTGLVGKQLNLTEADLRALTVVSITADQPKVGTVNFTGVRLSDLMAAAAVDTAAVSLVLTGSDGYSATIDLATVKACTDCMVAFTDTPGTFLSVMPGQAGKLWVKGLVKLEFK
jgi:tungstate transport system substrate-binding protein